MKSEARDGSIWILMAAARCLAVTLPLALAADRAPAQLLAKLDEPAASLDVTTVPAAAKSRTVLTVRRFGRYSVTVESEQGVALQLVDRMVGPGTVEGKAGEQDGRIDVFLDRGDYLIRTFGHPQAEGEATLAVHPFVEIAPEPAPQLVELKPIAGRLGDFEQVSYWLLVEERRWVHLEAAGRTLRDLRLWLEGSWLVDAEPETEVLDPREGQPLFACRLAVELDPGLYLLTAYGGREQPWADDSGEYPLHLRMGVPKLGIAGRARREVSPFGVDRFLVPARANYYRLELPEARLAVLRVGRWEKSTPYAETGTAARIEKQSRVPATEIQNGVEHNGYDTVTVRAEAGRPYVLQHFESRYHHVYKRTGSYWMSTIHSGHPSDSVEATAVVAEWNRRGDLQRRPFRAQTVEVGSRRGWATRSNLLEPLTVFVRVADTGVYRIDAEGVEALYRFEPFFVYRPPEYEPPDFRGAGKEWDLQAGYYVLTAKPVKKGILEMTVRPTGLLPELLDMVRLGPGASPEPVRASVRFPSVRLADRHRYEVFINRQPEVRAGLILRPLPMGLREPLPLTLRPGEETEIPFVVSEPARLEALVEDGTRLEISLDGGPWRTSHEVDPGNHRAEVRHGGEETIVLSVATVPLRLLETAPLPPLPASTLAGLPEFPVLTEEAPRSFDVELERPEVVLVSPGDDALYRLESTGLLDTEGKLRSRVVTALASSAAGGSGRNFFLHQYLNAGDYQLVVGPRGRSRGHLGVALERTDPMDGGELRLGLPARSALVAGESVVYSFEIEEEGRYRLRSFALGHTPRCRLEDAGRWPVTKPNVPADFDRRFEPGVYRLLLLPEPVDGRRLTLLEKALDPPSFEGHGPHQLPLDEVVRHRWLEPEEGQERERDLWQFELPGASEVSVILTGEMHGRIVRRDDGAEAAYVPPMRGFEGRLEAGRYRLEVECFRRNNRVDYQIGVRPTALLPGLESTLTAPRAIPVAVGESSLVEITSFGDKDVAARLVDADGRTVARGDDRAGDWNFHLAARLDPGEYTLHVDPVGSGSARTAVRMDAREEIAHATVTLPFDTTLEPGDAVHTFPLAAADGRLLTVSARSTENLGLALERRTDGGWETVALRADPEVAIELPVAGAEADRAYRLRLWSVDRRGNPVSLSAAAADPSRVSESRLAKGMSLRAAAGGELALAEVELPSPGVLRLLGSGREVRWSGAAGRALEPVAGEFLQAPAGRGWLAVRAPGGKARVQAARVELRNGDGLQLPLASAGPALVDLAPGRGGPRLVLARSMLGQPAVRVTAPGDQLSDLLAPVAVVDGAAASVALDEPLSAARVWLAQDTGSGIDVRLESLAFEPALPESADFGRTSGELETETRAYDLPPGQKRLALTLTPGIVAAVVAGDEVMSVHWGGGRPLAERFVTGGERLLLLHTWTELDRYSFEVLPASAGEGVLDAGSPFELSAATAGLTRLRIEPGTDGGRTVHTFGTDGATFQSDRGAVLRGDRLTIDADGGVLTLSHPPGLVLAWIGPEDDPAASGLWTGRSLPEPEDVGTPASVRLDGAAAVLAFEPERPILLSLTGGGRALYRLETASETRGWVAPEGSVHHVYLPAGRAELAVRAIGERSLAHDVEAVAVPVTPVGEGLGPEVLLPPGGAHAFHFTVVQPGPVGVGVRADSDSVECELLTTGGVSLGRDVVQMHELEAGDYLLLVRLAPARGAARARPAVVGVERPLTGPPDEEIRRYLAMERTAR
ncbi:MAG: hypothetical protein GY719_07835 [bacterium]|nr:hypothetical protein [bacterium]